MSIKFDENNNVIITVNYFDMIERMPDSEKVELAEQLSCEDAVIKHVVDQLLGGWTENGYRGSLSSSDLPSTELEICRERLGKIGNRLLRNEVKRLRNKLEDKNNHYESGWNAFHALNGRK
ncbi:coil containing protein [Vibrio phage 1.032.O._10N.261.54.F5]|nr:coil containing protein [Vibrio phage 1.032.O._10N.261.54.F5]